jgi:hypothetical protein
VAPLGAHLDKSVKCTAIVQAVVNSPRSFRVSITEVELASGSMHP